MNRTYLRDIDLCQFPAQMPPNNEMWNFVDPVSLQPTLIVVGVIMTTLSIFFTVVRIFINFRKLAIADYFALIGTFLVAGFTLVLLASSRYYRHFWDIPACWLDAAYLKLLFAEMVVFGPAVFFVKASIFLLYRQIFHMYPPMYYATYFGLFITSGAYLSSVAVGAYLGAPRPGERWEVLFLNGMPQREPVYGIIQGSIAIFIDVYIFILPLPILLKLNMSFQKQIQLVLLFGTALIGVVASVVAIAYRVQLLSLDDSTWHQACAYIAVIIENNVAIIVAAMPAFAAFFRTHVASTPLYQFLCTKCLIPCKRKVKTVTSSGGPSSRPQVATIGSPAVNKGPNPRDVHDNMPSHISWTDDVHEDMSQGGHDMMRQLSLAENYKHPSAVSPV